MEERKSRKGDVRETKIVGERERERGSWRVVAGEQAKDYGNVRTRMVFTFQKVVKLNLSIIKFVSFIFILFILAFSL